MYVYFYVCMVECVSMYVFLCACLHVSGVLCRAFEEPPKEVFLLLSVILFECDMHDLNNFTTCLNAYLMWAE